MKEHKCENEECNNLTTNPKYCSKSCSAKMSNKLYPRIGFRKNTTRKCKRKECNNIPYYKSQYCSDECKSTEKIRRQKERKLTNVSPSSAVINYRRRQKILAVEYKGGACIVCGYNRYIGSLHFHHLNSEEKDYGFSSNKKKVLAFENSKPELDKCVLVCGNCHSEIHAGLINIFEFVN